ncbi:MAG: hypothetical protein R2932_32115 [Caldilineaceae bacterium]
MNTTLQQLLCDLRCLWRQQPTQRDLIGGVGLALATGSPVPIYQQNLVAVLLRAAGLWRDEYREWVTDQIPSADEIIT